MAYNYYSQLILLLFAVIAIYLPGPHSDVLADTNNVVNVNIDYGRVAGRTSEEFLSLTIGAGAVGRNFSGLDLESERMINIGKALAPAVLRFGGTAEDYITYNMSDYSIRRGSYPNHGGKPLDNQHSSLGLDRGYSSEQTTMTAGQWDYLNEYMKSTGLSLVFGLNAQKRNENGSWNIDNARELIDYTKKKAYKVNYELGNEPDLYYEHTGELVVSGGQLAEDFRVLADYLKDTTDSYSLCGPDVATLDRGHFFQTFLNKTAEIGVGPNVITWHQYYGSGRTFKLEDFYSADVLDKLIRELGTVEDMLEEAGLHHAEMWLGETSSCYDGGAPGISDRFVAGFMWLDKLGLTALYNYTRICRQTLWGGSYSLINSSSGLPLPDFYASLAYKQLMGDRALSIQGQLERGRKVRVYAHCTRILPGR
eukprot:scpid45309/ scgid3881/ Heparanase; Endo-glucoronidase; Heparanase-1; Heparanase 8 kDa subunit; Heparanase 50 kDa subunit